MKTCPNCKSIYENYQECPNCKIPLVDELNERPYGPLMLEEYEADYKNYHRPLAKEKNQGRDLKGWFRSQRRSIFIIGGMCLILLFAIYLNLSQIPFDPLAQVQEEVAYQASFDGEYMDIYISRCGVNEYFDEFLCSWKGSKIWGLTISDVFYHPKRRALVLQLDGAFVHTSILMELDIFMKEDHLYMTIDHPRVGILELPLPHSFISAIIELPDKVKKGMKVPRYLSIDQVVYEESGILLKAKIDVEYMKAIINEYQGDLKLDYYAYAKTVNPYIWMIENHMKNYDQSTAATKNFLFDISKNPEYLKAALLLVNHAQAEDIVYKVFDGLPVLFSYDREALMKEHHIQRSQLEAGYPKWLEGEVKREILSFWESVIDSIERYHDRREEATFIVESRGRVYSLTTDEYLSLPTLVVETDLSIPFGRSYELYAEGVMPVIGIQVGDNYYITRDGINLEVLASKDAWLEEIDYHAMNDTPPSYLKEGDEERAIWEKSIGQFLGSPNGLFVRYLSSDGRNTYGIVSPLGHPQEIYQVLTTLENGTIKILDVFQEHDSINKEIIRHLKEEDFNVRVLPPFDIADFTLWFYADYQIEELSQHLYERGEIEEDEQVIFLSRVEDMLYMIYDSGREFFFDFEYGSNLNYDAYYKIFPSAPAVEYHHLLIDHDRYGFYLPTFIFLQD